MPATSAEASILVVDDEPSVARVIAAMASGLGYHVEIEETVERAIARIEEAPFDAVLADLYIGSGSGIDIVKRMQALKPDLPIVVITGQAAVSTALEAIREGAYDYLPKPCTREQIGNVLRGAVERKRLTDEVPHLEQAARGHRLEEVVGTSPRMLEVFKTVARVAATRSTVLITGESGTGKEQVARALHFNSPRARARFVPFNVMAIPELLLESELFGHLKGAFTGAYASRRGLLLEADGGTLFMDEVGDLPLALQAKLLRVLQERRFRPVGGDTEVEVDLRLVLATHRNLEEMVRQGRFREDLYYRLNVIAVHLPPLRERVEDIEALAEHFLRKLAGEIGLPPQRFSPEALDLLKSWSWPGNVRELENVVERAVALTHHPIITPDCLPSQLRAGPAEPACAPGPFATVNEVVWGHVQRVLQQLGGNQTRAARVLGISRRTLHRWLKDGSTHIGA